MKNYDLIPTASKSKQKLQYCVHGPNLLLEDLNEQIPEYKRKYHLSRRNWFEIGLKLI